MLDVALKYEDCLRVKFRDTWFDDKYKYFNCGNWYQDESMSTDTWNRHQFVSLNSKGEVIGYIGYDIDRGGNFCSNVYMINFSSDKITFGIDVGKCIEDVFERFKFEKIKFYVICGNPIEATYDKMVKKYNGNVVGLFKNDVKLIDGKMYDKKFYEIHRDGYMKSRYGDTSILSGMRDATEEEQRIVQEYVESISISTGLNFWDMLDADKKVKDEISSEKFINLVRLREISKLKKDWNGYGADEIPLSVIKRCEDVIKVLDVQPEVFPTGRQSVQIEYELDDGSYLEFEFLEDKVGCLFVPGDGDRKSRKYGRGVTYELDDISVEAEEINRIVNMLYKDIPEFLEGYLKDIVGSDDNGCN